MRPLETLLLLVETLTLVGLAARGLRRARWVGLLPPIAAFVEALVEGIRWQMVPAFALSIALGLAWSLRGASGRRGWTLALGVALGLLGLLASAVPPLALPVFGFPRPDGPYPVGTVVYYWLDTARRDVFTADPDDRRELVAQVWYPARSSTTARRAPYVEHPETLETLERLLHVPRGFLAHLRYVTTNAVPSSPMADGGSLFPVLVFLSGRGGYRQSNTFQVESLVSHGYVVVGLDQPHVASGVVFPDGRLVAMDARLFDPSRPGHAAFLDDVLPFLAEDVRFALDKVVSINQSDPQGILTGRLDLRHVGILGISLGGIVAGEACHVDPRIRACLVMDAFMPPDVVRAGLPQPTLWLSRDARTMQLEGWQQQDIDETQSTMRAVYDKLPSDGYLVLVPGMFHADFSDGPLLSPLTARLGISGSLRVDRAHEIVDAYSVAFFDRHLRGQAAPLLDGPDARFPEVLFAARLPPRR
jgi:predicted dienelactone hydrolase